MRDLVERSARGRVRFRLGESAKALECGGQFDPEPWILLNPIFSGVAFYTGRVITG